MENGRTKKTLNLKCKICGHAWEYHGFAPYYTSCPVCRANVKLRTKFEKEEIKIGDLT